jgi:hypothetical protein
VSGSGGVVCSWFLLFTAIIAVVRQKFHLSSCSDFRDRLSMTTVWIYIDTNKEVGDVDHLKVFATAELADEWFKENDLEGVAFGYEVIEE